MSGLSRHIFVIFLLIEMAGEIVIFSEDAIQYTAEGLSLDELDEKIF